MALVAVAGMWLPPHLQAVLDRGAGPLPSALRTGIHRLDALEERGEGWPVLAVAAAMAWAVGVSGGW